VSQFWGLDSDRILKLVLREIRLSQETPGGRRAMGHRLQLGEGGCMAIGGRPGVGRLPLPGGQCRARTRGVPPKAKASSRLGPGAKSGRGAGLGPTTGGP
jgi:hypothetical protein